MTEPGKSRSDLLTGEPVEGQLLSTRLEQGALPPLEAVQFAIDIGSALNQAHARGIVHGALSPSMVSLTAKGAVLLAPPAEERQNINYRSPEQVRGAPASSLSDVFSFGVVLYEMLTARRPFLAAPNTIDDVILNGAPPPLKSRVPLVTAAEGAIAGCLEKDPAKRRQRIKNVVADLKLSRSVQLRTGAARRPAERPAVEMPAAALAAGEVSTIGGLRKPPPRPVYVEVAAAPPNGFRNRLYLLVGLGCALAAAGVAAVLLLPASHAPALAGYRLDVNPPDNVRFAGTPAISPDGQNIAYTATGPEGKRMLWVRALDETHARVLPSTEGAFAPFWSPDSQYVAFFANESLKKVKAAAADPPNTPETICPAEALPGGGTWSAENTILFASGLTTGLLKVPAGGGKPVPVTKLDPAQSEMQHLWPQFLPDGKHFFFFVRSELDEVTGAYLGSLDSPQHTKLLISDSSAIYAPKPDGPPGEGYILFIRDRNLVGQPYSAAKLQLGSAPVREIVADVGPVESLSLSEISASTNGILIYQSSGKSTRHLVWMDRKGNSLSEFGQPADWGPPRISPDGRRVAVGKREANSDNAHIWILNAEDGRGFQTTDTPGATEVSPVWSPDGNKIAYVILQPHEFGLYVKPATAEAKGELLNSSAFLRHLEDWSHDGKYILFSELHPDTTWDIMGLTVSDKKSVPVLNTVHTEGYPALSADMKWLAYQSNESGAAEIYVQPFENGAPGTKRIYPVSQGGGNLPRWRRDGSELYYLANDGHMMAVAAHPANGEIAFEAPKPLFQTRPVPKTSNLYDVSPDGERFLLNLPMEWPNAAPITVTTGWSKDLTPPAK